MRNGQDFNPRTNEAKFLFPSVSSSFCFDFCCFEMEFYAVNFVVVVSSFSNSLTILANHLL